MSAAQTVEITTPGGLGRAHVYAAPQPRATLVLGHGAGGGIDAPDLALLARELPGEGYAVVLVEQPWKVAGRKIAGRPPTLDLAWTAILAELELTGALVVGGRSAGARVACRTAAEVGASGVLCLSFPLHPPGRPATSRAEELRHPLANGIPVRVIQGASDPWGSPTELADELGNAEWVVKVTGAHSFSRKPLDVLDAARLLLPLLI